MKLYIKCVSNVIAQCEGYDIRYNSMTGNFYVYLTNIEIAHPDLDELKRRIIEIFNAPAGDARTRLVNKYKTKSIL